MANWRCVGVISFAFGFALLPCARAQSCPNEEDRLPSCSDITKGSNLGSIKVVLSDVAQEHTCGNICPPVDFDDMLARCDAFCGEHGIPIMVGTDAVGFPLDDIDQVCLGPQPPPSNGPGGDVVLQYNPAKMRECRDWSDALDQVNVRAADFIASVRNMTFEQLVYRAAMQERVNDLQAVMQSDETAEVMDLARVDMKLTRLTEILRDNLADLMGDGMLKRQLRSKLDQLSRKSSALQQVISRNLPLLARFVEECNDLLLATGPLNEYMLDICSVTSSECIDSEEGGQTFGNHAACCCGVVPSVGQFSIPAAGQMSRRMQEPPQPDTQNVDVCGLAYQMSSADLEDASSRLGQIEGGAQIIEDYERSQRESYPAFYADCSNSRRLEEEHWKTSMETDDGHSVSPSTARRLQNYLTCDPPSHPTDTTITDPLRVAFWDKTESDLCKNILEEGVTLTTSRMAEICADFCTPTAVPFLLGTTSFGFTQEQLDSVCLAPEDDTTLYSADAVNNCHAKANSFETLQRRTAAFASALQVLDASKIRFEAEAKQATNNLKVIIREQAEQALDNARQSEKIGALRNLMQAALSDVVGNSRVKRRLITDAEAVRESAELLQETLDTVLPEVEDFLTRCNVMTTGVGPSNEYLLDMCSQTSQQCIDDDQAQHVGCCCGYNPVITLGTSGVAANIATISGLGAATFDCPGGSCGLTRVGRGRRVQEQTAVDICAEAIENSANNVQEHQAAVRDLGEDALIESRESENRDRYPAFYGRCEEWTVAVQTARSSSSSSQSSSVTSTSNAVPKELSVMVLVSFLLSCGMS